MCVFIGQFLLCLLSPVGTGDIETLGAETGVDDSPLVALALIHEADGPKQAPEKQQSLSAGKGERTSGAEERPGKRLRRDLSASWLRIVSTNAADVTWEWPAFPSVTVLSRGVRLQI